LRADSPGSTINPKQYVARLYGGSIAGPGVLEFAAPLYIVDEFNPNAVVTVRRRGGTTGPVSVVPTPMT